MGSRPGGGYIGSRFVVIKMMMMGRLFKNSSNFYLNYYTASGSCKVGYLFIYMYIYILENREMIDCIHKCWDIDIQGFIYISIIIQNSFCIYIL